jgi:hypothetical protein
MRCPLSHGTDPTLLRNNRFDEHPDTSENEVEEPEVGTEEPETTTTTTTTTTSPPAGPFSFFSPSFTYTLYHKVYVMITLLGDFYQIFIKKWRFSRKPMF